MQTQLSLKSNSQLHPGQSSKKLKACKLFNPSSLSQKNLKRLCKDFNLFSSTKKFKV